MIASQAASRSCNQHHLDPPILHSTYPKFDSYKPHYLVLYTYDNHRNTLKTPDKRPIALHSTSVCLSVSTLPHSALRE